MSETNPTPPVSIEWHDLTVLDAPGIAAFYQAVLGVGLTTESMGDYEDYNLMSGDDPIGGVCHARGSNSNVPPAWLIYFRVESMEQSLREVEARGGRVLDGPRPMGAGLFACVQDPAGAVCALWQRAG